jgi:predicted ATPase
LFFPALSKKEEVAATIRQFFSEHGRSRAIHQLFRSVFGIPSILWSDFTGAQSYNISPATVRLPEDIASEPKISQNGSGLAATLFALENARVRDERQPHFFRERRFKESKSTLGKIISYSRIVDESIRAIEVNADTIEAKLQISLTVDYDGTELSLPFSLVSDETAKWFTLVTAIVTSVSIFVIEEPENFPHPLMQKEIVRIIRDTFTSEEGGLAAIIATHSETILNSMDPQEIILVRMEQGKTFATRPANSGDIRSEIELTGFGAGYYYVAGTIE